MTPVRIFVSSVQKEFTQVRPAFRDVVQDPLYGRSGDALNLLCGTPLRRACCTACSTTCFPACAMSTLVRQSLPVSD